MHEKTIDNWQALASVAEKYMAEDWIFRGVGDVKHTLIPKIGRTETWRNFGPGTQGIYSPDFETKYTERFKREARPHIGIEPASDMDWLSIAQHHGLPTRLLDWTESPLVAAYFALSPAG